MINYIEHKGVSGMKWGYNDGKKNGKRTATERVETGYSTYDWLRSLPIYGLLSSDVTVKESIERGQKYIKENGYMTSLGIHTFRRK